MKGFIYIAIIIGFCSCENPILFKKEYTVSGTLYDSDEVTPVEGAILYLEGEATTFRAYYEIIAETTTDENGYFELTYKHNRKAETLRILSEFETGLLYSVPKNENYQRDICGKAVGYLDLTVNVERELVESDTIIVRMSGAEPITTHFEGRLNYLLHPFDELKRFQNIKTDWNRGISTDRITLQWGVGIKELREKGLDGDGGIDEYPENYHQVIIQGFPYTDRDTITIK